MASRPSSAQRGRLAQEARELFVAEAGRAMTDTVLAVQERLLVLVNEAAPSREMQVRRDAWTFFQRTKLGWREATVQAWQKALEPTPTFAKTDLQDFDMLQLVGTDVVENKILASRLVLRVIDKVSSELDDLRLRIKYLETSEDLDRHDVLRPEVLVLAMVEQWAANGMPSGSWPLVNDVVQALLSERLKLAYHKANQLLIEQGVMPVIELKDRVKRATSLGSTPRATTSRPPASEQGPRSGHQSLGNQSGFGSMSGRDRGAGPPSSGGMREAALQGGPPVDSGAGPDSRFPRQVDPSIETGAGALPGQRSGPATPRAVAGRERAHSAQAQDETRMMTSATPLARARSRAQGVLGQLKRLLVGRVGPEFDATSYEPASPALAAAIAVRGDRSGASSGSGTIVDDYNAAGVVRVANRLREQTSELKKKAETKGEKATIEIVALMFQAILQEERIPPAMRVWFARLQMPVCGLRWRSLIFSVPQVTRRGS